MQRLVFPTRETMPQFVCSLRQVDEWKKFQAKQSTAIAQAAYDLNAKYIKSPFAKSLKIEDVLRFLDDTVLDIDFMVQLPSIEKCLEQWWKLYAPPPARCVDQDQLRQVYYDLANVLVEAKTENIHKNSVSMIMRASWTKWGAKDPPLAPSEFYRLLFILAHLMTESNRLGDYVTFFQETLAKITRVHQSKAKCTELRKRKPRVHRKSSVIEIMGKGGVLRMHMGSRASLTPASSSVDGGDRSESAGSLPMEFDSSRTRVVSVSLDRVLTTQGSDSSGFIPGYLVNNDAGCEDRFVEVLDRRGVYSRQGATQHVVLDPLLLERQFQDKWRRPAHAKTLSSDDVMRELHPVTNKYVPPLCIARLQTTAPGVRGMLSRQCQSTPALKLKQSSHAVGEQRDEVDGKPNFASAREEDVLRRSLSMVTLKNRIQLNKSTAMARRRSEPRSKKQEEEAAPTIYLAIST